MTQKQKALSKEFLLLWRGLFAFESFSLRCNFQSLEAKKYMNRMTARRICRQFKANPEEAEKRVTTKLKIAPPFS
jgi:hypothetical protein